MKPIKIVVIAFTLVIGGVIASWLSVTVPSHTHRHDSASYSGTFASFAKDSASKDVGVVFAGISPNTYYINRGLETGLNFDSFEAIMKNKQVEVLYYNRGWNTLDPKRKIRHVCELRFEDKVVYSEIID